MFKPQNPTVGTVVASLSLLPLYSYYYLCNTDNYKPELAVWSKQRPNYEEVFRITSIHFDIL